MPIEGPDPTVIVADNAGLESNGRVVDVVFNVDGEGLLASLPVVANPDDVTEDGLYFVSCGLQMCPDSHRNIPQNKYPSV